MEQGDVSQRFRVESERVRSLLTASLDPATAVPIPAGLTIGALVDHLGEQWARRHGRTSARQDRAASSDFESVRRKLADDLGATAQLLTQPTGVAAHSDGFVHHLVMHRVDLELALGVPVTEVDPAFAAEGVEDCLLSIGLSPVSWDELALGESMTVHLHATDVDGAEWTIDTGSETFARAHLKADVAVRGPAWVLNRWCRGRLSVSPASAAEGLEHFGDVSTAEKWRPVLI